MAATIGTLATGLAVATCIPLGTIATGVAIVASIPLIAVGALAALGFTTAGVVGGSIAAAIQSACYGAFTCGLFSIFQSVAATAAIGAWACLAGLGWAVKAALLLLL